MKRILTFCLFLAISSQIAISQAIKNPLVSPEWLKERLGDENLLIYHVEGADEYLDEHIPGAIYIGRNHYTVSNQQEGVVYDLPETKELISLLEGKGIDDDKDILLYVANNRYELMTRLFFTLQYLGRSDRVYILDGGLQQWKESNGEVTDVIDKPEKGNFTATVNSQFVANLKYVKEQFPNDDYNIVDARAPVFYSGIQNSYNNQKGHIPGAKTIPYTSLMEEGPNGSLNFLSKDKLQAIYDEQELDKNKPIIVYCHIGQQATMVFFTARLLGYNIKFYDGSFFEWATNELPTEVN